MSCQLAPELVGTLLGLYGSMWAVVAVLTLRMLSRDQRASVPLVFLVLSLCFLSARVAWLTLHGFELGSDTCHKSVTFVLTRVAFVFYFAALTLLLFYWAQQYHRTVLDDPVYAFLPSVRWWFVGINVAVALYQLVVVILWFALGRAEEGSVLYDSNILFDVCVVSLVALVFGIYGIRLWRQAAEGGDTSEWRVREGRLFLFGTLLMVLPFTARVLMFMWRFVFPARERLPDAVFYTFAYAVPELLPLSVQLYVTRQRKQVGTEGRAFIARLYQDSHSDHLASFLLQSEPDALNEPSAVVTDGSMPSPIPEGANRPGLDFSVTDTDQ